MTTKKTSTTKKTTSKKAAKPRTIKVVGETDDDSAVDTTATEAPAAKATKKSKAAPKEKRLSAIDAAAKVLAEAGEPMNAKQLIDAIVTKGYWTSPAGKTPARHALQRDPARDQGQGQRRSVRQGRSWQVRSQDLRARP